MRINIIDFEWSWFCNKHKELKGIVRIEIGAKGTKIPIEIYIKHYIGGLNILVNDLSLALMEIDFD